MAPPNLPAYSKDERVLCFHHELLYEAKVLEHKHADPADKKTAILYRVHYKGWKNTWDDWVPQDRLRKFTEENKELAQDLRQDLKRELEAQRQRAAPKSAVGRKKTAGSDFSSIRGSEERHSSVPVTGRGTKRGRDMDLDKVRYQFSTESFLLDIQQFSTPVTDVFGYDTSLDLDYYNTSPPPKRQKQAFSARYCFGLDGTGEEPPEVSNTEQTDPDGELPAAPGGRKTRRVRVKTTKARELEESSAGQWAEAAAKKPKPKPKPKRVATLKREASVEAKAAPAMKPKGQRRRPREPASHESGNAGPVAGPKEPAATTSTKAKAKQPSLGPPNDNPTTSQPEKDKAPLEIPPGYHGEVKFKVGRIDGSKQEEAFHSRPAVRLPIPDHLKALLVDDWENVTKNLSLVPLPSAHPVSEILTAYLEEEKLKRRPGSAEWDLVEEVVAGLKEYFDQTLGRILLYRFEREQYFQVRKKMEKGDVKFVDKTASDIYGAEHLCRLFVTLPELIAQTNMDTQSVNRLREELTKITSWLGKNSQRFFTAEYEVASAEYTEKARGAE